VEYDNPYDVGMTGLIGFSSGFHTMMNADTLICSAPSSPIAPSTRRMPKSFRLISTRQHRRAQQGRYGAGGRYQIHAAALLPLLEENRSPFLDKALSDYRDARKGWTIWPNRATKPFTRSIWRSRSAISPTTTPFSPATWARQPSGRHAT
jgi:thiamine pyrophosphate-dependent acetolactate synthase large subunit-like protein